MPIDGQAFASDQLAAPSLHHRRASGSTHHPRLSHRVNSAAFLPAVPLRRCAAPWQSQRASSRVFTTCRIPSSPSSPGHRPSPRRQSLRNFQLNISRRAVLMFAAAAVVSTHPLTHLHQSPAACNANELPPYIDNEFELRDPLDHPDWEDYDYEPAPSNGTEKHEGRHIGTATYEDYLNVLRIPPIDYSAVARSYLNTALMFGLPVAVLSTVSAITFRASPRLQLPVFYDAEALKRYFSLRPDFVLRRLSQLAAEGALLAIGVACDALANSFDRVAVHLRLQTVRGQEQRCRERAQRRGVVLRDVITHLGPAMIKLGQAVASRPDLVSEPIVRELQPLQDDVLAVFPTEEAFAVIQDELGASVTAIFDKIDPVPVAGASLGMVFKGRVDGVDVAVKVQRPEVVASIGLDCYIVRLLAVTGMTLLGLRTDWRAAVDEYASRLFEELDYTNELDNMTRFREMYGDYEGIYLPRVFPEYCSRRVLVTEWIDGEKLIDEEVKVRSEDLGLVKTGIRFALMQLLDKGLLHADMHNGNMFRTRTGSLAYIDFGLVSEVPSGVRESIVCALVHLIHGEYSLLAETFAGMELMRSDDIEMELPVLTEALREAFEPDDELSCAFPRRTVQRFRNFTLVGVVTKLLLLGSRFPLVFRDYFLNNLRCLGMLEGLALNADPNFNVLSVVYPFVVKKILTGSSPRYRSALESLVIDSYGRIRWSRIDQLLVDAHATGKSAVSDTSEEVILSTITADLESDVDASTSLPNTSDVTSLSTPIVEVRAEAAVENPGRPNDVVAAEPQQNSGSSAKVVLSFIISDAGHFLRRYLTQQYLLNVELMWRRRIDERFNSTLSFDNETQVAWPLVNAKSSITRNAATRWLALHASARELSDDEAKLRTREFFRSTPFLKKVGVLMRLLPAVFIPWVKTVIGVVTYFAHRWMQAWVWKRSKGREEGDKEVENAQGNGVDDSEVSSTAAPEMSERERREWRGFESSFSRKARRAQVSGRSSVT